MPWFAKAVLDEAVSYGFEGDLELRSLIMNGLISARTLQLIDEALRAIPETGFADMDIAVSRADG